MTDSINEAELAELRAAFAGFQRTTDATTKGLGLGVNIRFSAKHLFQAAWKLTHACLRIASVAKAGPNPLVLLQIGADVFSAITAALDGCRQKLTPAEYLTCIILSSMSEGLREDTLQPVLRSFIDQISKSGSSLPWYLFVDAALAECALAELNTLERWDSLLEGDAFRSLVKRQDGVLTYTEKSFEWGLRV
jgi:hypothetical protein